VAILTIILLFGLFAGFLGVAWQATYLQGKVNKTDRLLAFLFPPFSAAAVVFVWSPWAAKILNFIPVPTFLAPLGWLAVTIGCSVWLSRTMQQPDCQSGKENLSKADAGAIGCLVFVGQFVLGLAIIFFGCSALH